LGASSQGTHDCSSVATHQRRGDGHRVGGHGADAAGLVAGVLAGHVGVVEGAAAGRESNGTDVTAK
jgi:hypothetical protein